MKLADRIGDWISKFFEIFPNDEVEMLLFDRIDKWTTDFIAAVMGGGP
jgi:hypothetical protein